MDEKAYRLHTAICVWYLWRSNNCNEVTHHIVFAYFNIFRMAVVHTRCRLNKTKVWQRQSNGITVITEAFSHQYLTTQCYQLQATKNRHKRTAKAYGMNCTSLIYVWYGISNNMCKFTIFNMHIFCVFRLSRICVSFYISLKEFNAILSLFTINPG